MTQDEIIRMAREAGLIHAQDTDGQWDGITNQQLLGYPYKNPRDQEWAEKRIVEILEPFAALVAAHEREKQAEPTAIKEPVVIFAQYYADGTCRMQQFSNGITEWYGAEGNLILRSDASNPVVIDYAEAIRAR